MADFPGLKLTNAGRELQAKAQTGQVLLFTRVGLGDGAAPADLTTLTGLVNQRQPLSIQRQEVPGDGTAVLRVILTNQGLAAGFFMRELGVFAQDPDTGEELLYSYSNCGEFADFLPAAGGATLVEQIFDLITIIGDAENVTAVIDDYITIALKSEVDALVPRLMPAGGTVGQMVRKASNAEGAVEYFSPELDGFDVRLTSVEEPRVAVANQRVFTLQQTVTNGLAVYINGERLSREAWAALSATQLQLDDPLVAGTRVLFVNNEEAGPGRALNVSMTGPTLVYPASSNSFTITDFDSFSVYAATTTVGTVTRNGAALTLDIPAEAPEGTLDLEVTRDNVRATYRIAVGAAAIAAPEILAPLAGATNVTFEPDLAASAFVAYPAGYDSHAATRWQVARDTGFTDLVFDQQGADNLTAISLAAAGVRLDPATRYYVRAQYHGATLVSEWSAVVAFNTATIYIRKPTITSPLDGAVNVSTGLTVIADAFSVSGGADAHASSRWQVSAVADFSSVLVDSGWSTTQLTSFKPAGLAMQTGYFVRVKYRGAEVGESEWSSVIGFVTATQLQGAYTSLAGGPASRTDGVMVSINGDLYLHGGRYNNISGYMRADLWKFTPSTGTWTQKAFSKALQEHVAVAINGLMYLYGGSWSSGGGTYPNDLWIYNPVSDSATVGASPATGGRTTAVACALNGKMYVAGGVVNGTISKEFLCYDPAVNSWSTLANCPYAVWGISAKLVAAAGKIYLIGAASVYWFDPETGIWTQKSNFPFFTTSNFGAVAVNGRIYRYAGYSSSTYYRNLYVYDPAQDSWEQLPAGGYARSSPIMAEAGGSMYVFGGANDVNYLADFWSIN